MEIVYTSPRPPRETNKCEAHFAPANLKCSDYPQCPQISCCQTLHNNNCRNDTTVLLKTLSSPPRCLRSPPPPTWQSTEEESRHQLLQLLQLVEPGRPFRAYPRVRGLHAAIPPVTIARRGHVLSLALYVGNRDDVAGVEFWLHHELLFHPVSGGEDLVPPAQRLLFGSTGSPRYLGHREIRGVLRHVRGRLLVRREGHWGDFGRQCFSMYGFNNGFVGEFFSAV